MEQYVSYQGEVSTFKDIQFGVPLGSVLAPLLFVIYNNIILSVSPLKFVLYCNDWTGLNFEKIKDASKQNSGKLENFANNRFENSGLKLNFNKKLHLTISRNRSRTDGSAVWLAWYCPWWQSKMVGLVKNYEENLVLVFLNCDNLNK